MARAILAFFEPKFDGSKIEMYYKINRMYIDKNKQTLKNKSIFPLFFRIVSWLILFALFLAVAYGVFFVYKTNWAGSKINPATETSPSFLETAKNLAFKKDINLHGFSDGRINILLLGIAGQGKAGTNLTDTIMVASINTKTNQIAFLSIPRDFYAENIDKNGEKTGVTSKINSTYQYGLTSNDGNYGEAAQTIENTAENILGQRINYYIVLNFDGFQKIIDSIGGVNITSERDIFDTSYPGPNFSYETFELPKGFHHLDGATTLKYVRERHNDPEGDFGRAKRQQQVMQAVKSKVFSAQTLLNVFTLNNLFDTLGENIKTDIKPSELGDFVELTKKLDTNNINNVVLDAWNKDSLLRVSHIFSGDVRAFILIPRVGNYSEIQDLANNVFDLNKIKRQKEEIATENANLAIINKSGDAKSFAKIKNLLSDNLGYKNITVIYDNTKTTEASTLIYDFSGKSKPFTLDELIKKLPASLATNNSFAQKYLANSKADILIVVGKDLANVYNMEEDSVEDWKKADEQNNF